MKNKDRENHNNSLFYSLFNNFLSLSEVFLCVVNNNKMAFWPFAFFSILGSFYLFFFTLRLLPILPFFFCPFYTLISFILSTLFTPILPLPCFFYPLISYSTFFVFLSSFLPRYFTHVFAFFSTFLSYLFSIYPIILPFPFLSFYFTLLSSLFILFYQLFRIFEVEFWLSDFREGWLVRLIWRTGFHTLLLGRFLKN